MQLVNFAKAPGFLQASFLLLAVLVDFTQACSCRLPDLETACCYNAVVMRAKFLKVIIDPETHPFQETVRYEIKPIKVYKGGKELENINFVYTSAPPDSCGYKHKGPLDGKEYLFSGTYRRDRVSISLCSFSKPWDELTWTERNILSRNGDETCGCL